MGGVAGRWPAGVESPGSGVVVLFEPEDDCGDSAVGVGVWGEVEFGEDVADVGFGSSWVESELFGDGGVGVALGHEGEDLSFSFGEAVEFAVVVWSLDELGDDVGVDDAAAVGDSVEGVEEGVDFGDSVFEEVADAGGALFEQFDGVSGLDVL